MISGQLRRLPTGCAIPRRAGAKAACRGCFRPAAPSTDRLRRPTMGRSKSGLPGCAPACGSVYRQAAAACDGQGQKPRGGMISGQLRRLPTRCAVLRRAGEKATGWDDLRPVAASTDRLRLSAMGRGKSHLPGCAPVCRAVCRPVAPSYDGQGQKPRGGMISGLLCRLPTGCGGLRGAGAKATCWGDLARRAVCRPAAAACEGQRQKRPAGVCSGLPCRLPTGCGGLRRAGAKATCRGDLPLFCKIRRVGEVYPRH